MFSPKQLAVSAVIGSTVVIAAAAPALACHKKDVKPADHKVGICHATGSKTNPYVYIQVDEHAEKAHQDHQDDLDIVGVKSAKDCPKPATSTPAPKGGQGGGEVLGSSTTAPAQAQPQPTVLPQTGASAGLSALIGVPAMALAGRAYLRSRHGR
jgi:hypothetical protein